MITIGDFRNDIRKVFILRRTPWQSHGVCASGCRRCASADGIHRAVGGMAGNRAGLPASFRHVRSMGFISLLATCWGQRLMTRRKAGVALLPRLSQVVHGCVMAQDVRSYCRKLRSYRGGGLSDFRGWSYFGLTQGVTPVCPIKSC